MKRAFDITFSLLGLIILLPFGLLISLLILLDSKGSILFNQTRIGRYQKPFRLLKFRTMQIDAEKRGMLTVGSRDPRITRVGYWLRKSKFDELPQLINVFIGKMSLVGPRPEVEKFVLHYSAVQKEVLSVKPGITDWASIRFRNENILIEKSSDPEQFYLNEVMPLKLDLNREYLQMHNIWIDIKIILLTIFPFLRSRTMRKLDNKYANTSLSSEE